MLIFIQIENQKRGVDMKYLKKRQVHEMYKQMARIQGISVKELLQNIEMNIEDLKNSDDPEQQVIFQSVFGNKTPTPDEYIIKMGEYSLK